MHHGQNRGGNTRKVCKKQVNLRKTGGKFVKVEGKNNFRETRGEMYWNSENREEIRNLWSMSLKRERICKALDELAWEEALFEVEWEEPLFEISWEQAMIELACEEALFEIACEEALFDLA